ncbi:MAG: glycosyl transferase [Bacteroidetes bacterium]|nr:MAG: glycosyl transferase [Bacteroidota bacterium]
MKILYSVQATGNGHIARAIELLPYLQQYGQVDVFLSGSNSHVPHHSLPVKYRSKGLSLFYGHRGGLHYGKIWQALDVQHIYQYAKELPVAAYDAVLNDFDCITSLACKLQKVPSLHWGHQASFQNANTPRPAKRNWLGEAVLTHYATATDYLGLHFSKYGGKIVSPVIKEKVLAAKPVNHGHFTVYLSHYHYQQVLKAVEPLTDFHFHIFSKDVLRPQSGKNYTLFPINNEVFTQSMLSCAGVITGAGFETPAEALYAGKKLLCIPIAGQYEQWCNAAALKAFEVPIVAKLDTSFEQHFYQWLLTEQLPLTLQENTQQIVDTAVQMAYNIRSQNHWLSKLQLQETDLLELAI